MPVETRRHWVSVLDLLALTRQCELAGVARSTVYAPGLATKPDEQELALLALIDAEYTRHPFFGSRKMTVYLRGMGYRINRGSCKTRLMSGIYFTCRGVKRGLGAAISGMM